MSDSTALEFTIDNRYPHDCQFVYQLRKIYGSKRPGYLFVHCVFQCCTITQLNSNLITIIIEL